MAGKIIIYPPALFEVYEIGRNAKFSQTLIFKKKKPHSQEGGRLWGSG